MAFNTFGADAFTRSLMAGFGLVDTMAANRRQEKLLEERLAMQREEQRLQRERLRQAETRDAQDFNFRKDRENFLRDRDAFDRNRLETADARTARLFEQSQEDRNKLIAGNELAQNPNASLEDLAPFAPFSPAAAARIEELQGNQALRTLADFGSGDSGGGLADIVAGPQAQPPAAAPTAQPELNLPPADQSLLAPSRANTRRIALDDIDELDPEFRELGLVGRIGDEIMGLGRAGTQTVRELLARNPLSAGPVGLDAIREREREANPLGAGLQGEIIAPGDIRTVDELNALPLDQRAAAAKASEEALAGFKSSVEPAGSRVGTLSRASRELGRERAGAKARLTSDYESLLDVTKPSALRDLVTEDPSAAARQYFQDINTLRDTNPELASKVTEEFRPVLESHAAKLQDDVLQLRISDPSSREATVRQRELARTHSTLQQLYDDYKPAKAAGVRNGSMPQGNEALSREVTQAAVNSPELPGPMSNRRANAALTQVSRIAPGKRITDAQINALRHAVKAGWMTGDEMFTTLNTGQLPRKIEELKSFSPSATIIGQGPNGELRVIREGVVASTKGSDKNSVTDNQFSKDSFNWALQGLKSMYPDEETAERLFPQMQAFLADNESEIRNQFDVDDPSDMIRIGARWAQSHRVFREEDGTFEILFANRNPTVKEMFFGIQGDEEEIAADNDVTLTELDPARALPQLDLTGLRQELASGRYGPIAQEIAKKGSQEQLAEVARILSQGNEQPSE